MRLADPAPDVAARCGACTSRFSLAAWRALPVVQRLTPAASLVVRWPAGVTIEIRRCSGCGGSIARTGEGE
jgi:hypothetical protein